MHKELISVVIPAYNHENFIGPAIDSVLGQTYPNFELLIIDDGSTDKTAEVIHSYNDPRISYVYQENQDAYNTINRGLKMAQGKYISILNSDDMYAPDRLEKLLSIQKAKDTACLFTDVVPISDTGEVFHDPGFGWNRWHQKNRGFYKTCGDLYKAFLKGNFMVTTSNLFMTKKAADKVGPFCSLRYLHDYDFIFRMMLKFPHRVGYVSDQKLLFYRIHSGNTLSEAAIIGRQQDQMVIRKYMLKRISAIYHDSVNRGIRKIVCLERLSWKFRGFHNDHPPLIRKLCGAGSRCLKLIQKTYEKQLIGRFAISERPYLQAGISRLIELENELRDVKRQLRQNH